jgi:flavorubredoxin
MERRGRLKKTSVLVFCEFYGNTERMAHAIGRGIRDGADAESWI